MSDRKRLPGKFVWFELVSKDPKKAQAFYGDVRRNRAHPGGWSGAAGARARRSGARAARSACDPAPRAARAHSASGVVVSTGGAPNYLVDGVDNWNVSGGVLNFLGFTATAITCTG